MARAQTTRTSTVSFGATTIAAVLLSFSGQTSAQQQSTTVAPESSPLSFVVTGGGSLQSDTDLDNGGHFEATRYEAAVAARWKLNADSNLTFRFGYGVDDYDFEGPTGLAAIDPWEDVHTASFSVLYERTLDSNWSMFVGPRVISSRESGADFGDSMTWGGVAGVSWQQTPDLRLGVGVGVLSQLEDDAKIFPSIIVNWQIDENWRLTSQGGTVIGGITGLELTYALGNGWEAAIGGSYRFKRFRLDDAPSGFAPDGVGEETSLPLWVRASYEVADGAEIGAFVGVSTGTELRVEDLNGNRLRSDDADGGMFFGAYGRLRF